MNNMSVNPVRETQQHNAVSVKSDNKQTKEAAKKDSDHVQVSPMSQRLSSGNNVSTREDMTIDEGKDLAANVVAGQRSFSEAQSAFITEDFVKSLLDRSPYEQ